MSESYTPGPWRYAEDYPLVPHPDSGSFAVCDDEAGKPVAFLNNWNRDANGHLLAAAPILRDALQGLLDAAAGVEGADQTEAVKAAEAAIAKAKGE